MKLPGLLQLFTVGTTAAVLSVYATACSGHDASVAFVVPNEVATVIPSGAAIAAGTHADFNNDGTSDLVTYGPIVNNQNTQIGLLTDVDGHVVTFTDPVGIQFKTEDFNTDGVADLGVWSGNPAAWHEFSWSNDSWVNSATIPPR